MTIREIAKLAGCSPSTVSRVLSSKKCSIPISKKTRDKILEVCEKHDYMPNIHASRFFSKQSKIVGFLIPQAESLVDDNLARGMSTIYETLNHNFYRMLPLTLDDKFIENQEHLNLFKRGEIDALIIWGTVGSCKWIDELAANCMPFVLLTNRYKDYPAVYCDDAFGVKQLVKHCRKRGGKSFVYVTISGGDCCLRRRTEFLKLVPDGKLIEGGLNIKDGERIIDEVLRLHPDVVICGNDRVAIGLQKALRNAGIKIPEDIMITGADNIELAEYCPVPLTTYNQLPNKCGELCAGMILNFLQKQKPLSTIKVKPEICIRNSA
jgi:DNA-binding LacI/PurR family transcriptional regulator